jgi:hypothetical protein
MHSFNVGDHITPDNGFRGENVYEVTAQEGIVIVIKFQQAHDSWRNSIGTLVSRNVDSLYILHEPRDTNRVTVDSTDYMISTLLSDEDKLIIKEHLYYAQRSTQHSN